MSIIELKSYQNLKKQTYAQLPDHFLNFLDNKDVQLKYVNRKLKPNHIKICTKLGRLFFKKDIEWLNLSFSYISALTGIEIRAVKQYMKELLDLGIFTREHTKGAITRKVQGKFKYFGKNRQGFLSNNYRLNLEIIDCYTVDQIKDNFMMKNFEVQESQEIRKCVNDFTYDDSKEVEDTNEIKNLEVVKDIVKSIVGGSGELHHSYRQPNYKNTTSINNGTNYEQQSRQKIVVNSENNNKKIKKEKSNVINLMQKVNIGKVEEQRKVLTEGGKIKPLESKYLQAYFDRIRVDTRRHDKEAKAFLDIRGRFASDNEIGACLKREIDKQNAKGSTFPLNICLLRKHCDIILISLEKDKQKDKDYHLNARRYSKQQEYDKKRREIEVGTAKLKVLSASEILNAKSKEEIKQIKIDFLNLEENKDLKVIYNHTFDINTPWLRTKFSNYIFERFKQNE